MANTIQLRGHHLHILSDYVTVNERNPRDIYLLDYDIIMTHWEQEYPIVHGFHIVATMKDILAGNRTVLLTDTLSGLCTTCSIEKFEECFSDKENVGDKDRKTLAKYNLFPEQQYSSDELIAHLQNQEETNLRYAAFLKRKGRLERIISI